MLLIVGGLVLAVLWAAGKSTTAVGKAGDVVSLPPPNPIPYSPGQALISPAMTGGSSMLQGANQVRLQTLMRNVQPANNMLSYRPVGSIPPQLPTSMNSMGGALPTAAPLPVVEQGAAGGLYTQYQFRKV